MPLFYKNFFFVFFLFLFFSFSLETNACRTPSTLKGNELTKEECGSFGGSCSGCGSGQIKLGTCTGIFQGGACGISEEKYKKLIEEGKLPTDPFYEKPPEGTTECSKVPDAQCNQNCASVSNGYSIGKCDNGPPIVYCCKPGISSESTTNASFDYTPLEPIPGTEGMDTSTLKGFLEGLFLFVLWSAGIAALFMLVIGGFWYMTSAGNTSRVTEAKNIIANALWGLVIVLITWLILYVINPDLVRIDLSSLEALGIQVTEDVGDPNKDIVDTPITVGCGKIVEAAHQMVDSGCQYSQPKRNACGRSPAYTDCSDFTFHAYKRAGCNTGFGNTTLSMIGKTPLFDGNSSSLKAGDALVYNYSGKGHVVICEQDGCATITHASGSKTRPNLKKGMRNHMLNKKDLHVIRAQTYCQNIDASSC